MTRVIAVPLLLLFMASPSDAASLPQPASVVAGYEQVLVPFDTVTLPGQLGSRWSAELWVRNDSDTTVNLFPERCVSIGREFPCSTRIEIPARTSRLLDQIPAVSDRGSGLMLYVPQDRVEQVHFSLRVRDLSRQLDSAGTEVPVVRQKNFKTKTATILNVPIAGGFRLTLRLFSVEPAEFLVRVYQEQTDQRLAERTFSYLLPTDGLHPIVVPGTLDLTPVLNDVERAGGTSVRITIERLRHAGNFFPLLSITNNRTQQITIVTAQ